MNESSRVELLACLIYHRGQAEVAEVYGRLHTDEEARCKWQETRNMHYLFVSVLEKVLHQKPDPLLAFADECFREIRWQIAVDRPTKTNQQMRKNIRAVCNKWWNGKVEP
jgi:hypothetical protein